MLYIIYNEKQKNMIFGVEKQMQGYLLFNVLSDIDIRRYYTTGMVSLPSVMFMSSCVSPSVVTRSSDVSAT